MGKGVKSKDNEKTGVFTKELFGMTLILFSVLAFLCLVTGNTLVDVLGGGVQSFLLGCFGVYSFFVLFYLGALGFKLVSGKKFLPEDKRLYGFLFNAFIAIVFFILHLAIGFDASLSVGDQIATSFSKGSGGFSTTTPGGAVASIITAPISKVASVPGTFVIFSIALVLVIFFLIRKKINFSFVRKNKSESKEQNEKPSAPSAKSHKESKTDDVTNYEKEKIPASETRPHGYFFCENDSFEYKSKKELASGIPSRLSPFSGRFEFKRMPVDGYTTRQPQVRAESKSYTQSYSGVRGDTAYSMAKKEKLSAIISGGKPIGRVTPDNVGNSSIYGRSSGYDEKVDRPDSEYSVSHRTAYTPVSDSSRQDGLSSVRVIDRTGDSPLRETSQRNADYAARTEPIPKTTDYVSHGDGDVVRDLGSRSLKEADPVAVRSGRIQPAEPVETLEIREENSDRTSRVATPVSSFDRATDKRTTTAVSSDIEANTGYASRVQAECKTVSTEEVKENSRTVTPRVQTSPFATTPARTAVPASSRPAPSVVPSAVKEKKTYTIPDDGSDSIENMPINYRYKAPPIDLLFDYKPDKEAIAREDEMRKKNAETIVQVVKRSTGVDVVVERIIVGPSVTRYDISIPDDESPKSVFAAKSDLTFRLRANDLKMYNIPNESLIGIEMANKTTTIVGLKAVLTSQKYKTLKKKGLQFVLGEDILGESVVLDLARMPHLIVSGATGMGKSVCLSSLLISLLYRYSPDEMRLIIIDPKIVEFNMYKGIPHLVFNDIIGIDNRAMAVLEWAVEEMERRYQLLADNFCKDIGEYNESIDKTKEKKMPFIVILIDEFADLIMADDKNRKKIETYIGRLAQKARASGISLILATQRPSANIISGSIKTNIPSRICFKTSTSTDSRVVIDENGAEKLVCKGDCLYKTSDEGFLKRAQGSLISNDEIKLVLDYIKNNNKCYYDNKVLEFLNNFASAEEGSATDEGDSASAEGIVVDDVMKKALRIVIAHRTVSNSMLRTKLGIGYNRAATIIEWMARMKFVSPVIDNKSRTILIDRQGYEELYGEFIEDFT